MRFFKAFSLLHRRTKSETFITGYIPPNQGSFAVSNLNSRPSSLPAGLGSNNQDSTDISSVFDFATAKFTPISANFNYLRGINNAVITSPHRRTGNSQNGLSSLLVEENMRLRDSLHLWFSEYSKTDQLLQECRAELAFERDKNRTWQRQTARDQELIMDLKKDISRYEQRFEDSRDPGSSNQCSRYQSTSPSHNTLLLPGTFDSASSLVISKKIRTLSEYTSALRMTLSTRRQLRDQKKVAKFWKNIALSTGKCEDIITPSTSAISSVHGTLPPERKSAIDGLMRERGWPYPQVPSPEPEAQVDNSSSEPPSEGSLSGDLSLSRIHPVSSIATTLQSTSSTNTVGSRLAPLASESLKAEINLLFGIQRSEKPLPPPSKKYRPAAALTFTPSKTMEESPSRLGNVLRASLTGSYGDLGQHFSNLFSQDRVPRVKLPEAGAKDPRQNPEPVTGSQPSSLEEFSAPSGSSQNFGEALASSQGQHDTNTRFNLHLHREGIKSLKSGRSWQKYLTPAAKHIPSTIGMPKKKVFVGKENAVLFSKPSSILKKSSNPKASVCKD